MGRGPGHPSRPLRNRLLTRDGRTVPPGRMNETRYMPPRVGVLSYLPRIFVFHFLVRVGVLEFYIIKARAMRAARADPAAP